MLEQAPIQDWGRWSGRRQRRIELHKEKQRWCGQCRPLLLFCLLATRYNALDTIKARTKEKGNAAALTKQSSNKKEEGNAAALTKAKGKCALIERSMIGLNSWTFQFSTAHPLSPLNRTWNHLWKFAAEWGIVKLMMLSCKLLPPTSSYWQQLTAKDSCRAACQSGSGDYDFYVGKECQKMVLLILLACHLRQHLLSNTKAFLERVIIWLNVSSSKHLNHMCKWSKKTMTTRNVQV